jgi:hypothetical protein
MDKIVKTGLADLLEQIADETVFDKDKYFLFNRTMGNGNVDPVIGSAANELTEYYSNWEHFGKRLREDPTLNEKTTKKARHRLKELAKEIRSLS